ncbi:unnamed protein product [Laminaria digitata]
MAAIMSKPARKHKPETLSALYKLAARNLRESHGVPSMTALKLEKTVALLRLAPRRVVKQGLAPRKLLEGETGELADADADILGNNNSSSEEEKGGSNDSDSMHDDKINGINNNGVGSKGDVEVLEADDSGKARRPIHAALVAGGINLRPDETRPLLRALGVKPHRLVRLGLVKREALRAMRGGSDGGPGKRRRLRAGGPRQGGAGRPHGPPRDHGSPPMHGPPRSFHGEGHDAMDLGEVSEGEGPQHSTLGPHGGSEHLGLRHQGGRLQGPPDGPCQHGRRGGGKHGHEHHHPPHGHGHGQGHSEGEGEEGKRLHGEAPGPGQRGPRRHGGGMGARSDGPPHGPPRGPFHEGGSGASHGMMAHPHHGPPSRGGGMKQRGGRHGGRGARGGGGGGGGRRQHGRVAHLAHSDGHEQPQLEAN